MFRGPVKLLSSFLEGGKGEAGLAAKLKEVGGWIVKISHHHQNHTSQGIYNIMNNIYFLHLHNAQQKKAKNKQTK